MATFDYNPITGNLDLVGSGASYINGVVADPTALPVTVGTPPLDSVYLAKAGSGVWLINRKPAGLYCRVANNGNLNDWQHLGAFPEVNADGNWELYNSADPTKELKFNLSGIATGTTRIITVPNKNITLDDASDARTPTAHNHAASAITSGVFDNARINFAAPSAIGSTTPSTGAFTTLSANNGTITASAPVLDLAQTWNNAAVTFTGMRVNATNTASATASLIADFQTGGTSRASIRQDGRINCFQVVSSDSVISGLNVQAATSSFFTWSGADMLIARDAADVLAIRRSANPQTFRIYNTNDSSTAAGTNFERGFIGWSSNTLRIGTEAGGTGSARNLELQTGGTTRLTVDNAGTVVLQSAGGLTFSGRTGIGSPSAGSIRLLGTDGSSFNFLYLGVQSASYPALKRVGTALQVRLGDDSAFAPLECSNLTVNGTTNGTVGSAVGLLLSAASTNNITFQTNGTSRWIIGGSSGALQGSDGVPIRLGGSTSSFPLLKNSGAIVQARLADDTGYTTIDANHRLQGTAPATSGATGTAGDIRYDADYIYVCTAANTWKRAAIATW